MALPGPAQLYVNERQCKGKTIKQTSHAGSCTQDAFLSRAEPENCSEQINGKAFTLKRKQKKNEREKKSFSHGCLVLPNILR